MWNSAVAIRITRTQANRQTNKQTNNTNNNCACCLSGLVCKHWSFVKISYVSFNYVVSWILRVRSRARAPLIRPNTTTTKHQHYRKREKNHMTKLWVWLLVHSTYSTQCGNREIHLIWFFFCFVLFAVVVCVLLLLLLFFLIRIQWSAHQVASLLAFKSSHTEVYSLTEFDHVQLDRLLFVHDSWVFLPLSVRDLDTLYFIHINWSNSVRFSLSLSSK